MLSPLFLTPTVQCVTFAGDGSVDFKEFSNNTRGAAADPNIKGPFDYYDKLGGDADGEILKADVQIVFNELDRNSKVLSIL